MASASSSYTPLGDVQGIVDRLRETFFAGKTRSVRYRKDQLKHLAYLVKDNESLIYEALEKDLGRGANESYQVETAGLMNEIIEAVHNVEKWAKTESVPVDLSFKLVSPKVYKEPKGVALVIGTWNYPIGLTLGPLVGAIAAGCPAVLKCSEVAPHSASLLAKLIPQYLDPEAYTVVLGEADLASELLKYTWGHIFYTGNGKVARIVAGAAAKTLSPITLELGGKSPVFIDPDLRDYTTTARRLLWGKRINAGQTCIAPDYVVVTEAKQQLLIDALEKEYKRVFPTEEQAEDTKMAKIVSKNHFSRLTSALDRTEGSIVFDHSKDGEADWLGLAVVKDVKWSDELMKDEIFGPILPIVPVQNIQEGIDQLKGKTPLSLYVFSQNNKFVDRIRNSTQSGAILQNDSLIHFTIGTLPFGGIGESGQGNYHGKKSFDVFTHERASLNNPLWADFLLAVRYFPHTSGKTNMLRRVNKSINFARPPPGVRRDEPVEKGLPWLRYCILAGIAALLARQAGGIWAFLSSYQLVKKNIGHT